ncbi:hypothetical protein KP509_08G019600 [Ceratopteris richardii]|uniref:MBD domain-containing protein n=1 Tax=Ceratopteris richardii TaxID=49495 RepID=A0A8T2U8A4_CERRI|nr:hypothetical protein KP509_08G019600 [Ceratopteris richardii]
MLQQNPEYKDLPLHRIHSRRLSAKDFDFHAPTTASDVFTTLSKIEPHVLHTTASLTHQSTIHQNEPGNHQPPHETTPSELATTIWPPNTTNYWFPNWKELFHGFVVTQKAEPKPSSVSSCEQSRGILQQNSGLNSQYFGSHQSICFGSNNNMITPLHSNSSSFQFTSSQSVCVLDPSIPSFPISINQEDVAHRSALPVLFDNDQAKIRDFGKTYGSSTQTPRDMMNGSIGHPPWLPQGWSIESRIRRTGVNAGKLRKYFRHLASGRRFRSRKDVLHFISTGKCRMKKQSKGKNVLKLSMDDSIRLSYSRKKLKIPEGSKGLFQGTEYTNSTNTANLSFLGHSEPTLHDDIRDPCKQLNLLCSTSSVIHSTGDVLAQERGHKLMVKRKDMPVLSKDCEDKQGSKDLQWLTKPVIAKSCIPLNQEGITLYYNSPTVEKEKADERNAKQFNLIEQKDQRTSQLGKEIQAAQDSVIQMSKEIQATAEKLSQEILKAQKDVKLDNGMKISKENSDFLSANDLDYSKTSKTSGAISRPKDTRSIEHQASSPPGVTQDIRQRITHLPTAPECNTFGFIQWPISMPDIRNEGQFVLQAVTQWPKSCLISLPAYPLHASPSVMMHPEMQMAMIAHAVMENTAFVAKNHHEVITSAIGSSQEASTKRVQMPAVDVERTEASTSLTEDSLQPVAGHGAFFCHKGNMSSQLPSTSANKHIEMVESCTTTQAVTNKTTDDMHTNVRTLLDNKLKQSGANDPEATKTSVHSIVLPDGNHDISVERYSPLLFSTNGYKAHEDNEVLVGEICTSIHQISHQTDNACSSFEIRGLQRMIDEKESMKQQQMDEIMAKRLRRKKFSAVLNPKLDLSRLSPSLTTRQRAKVVERMKARHARELLAALGKHICRKAVRRKV